MRYFYSLFTCFFFSLSLYGDNSKKETLMQNITVGIYSGTFDPPTNAHNHIIRSSLKNLNLKRIYVIVNKNGKKIINVAQKNAQKW